MTRIIWIVACSLSVGGCMGDGGVPLVATPGTPAICEALRPAMPILYHSQSNGMEDVSIKRIRSRERSVYKAACG